MVNARSEKWGGSHAEMFQLARTAVSNGTPGSDMAVCVFLAHFHIWQWERAFQKNKVKAEAHLKDKKVNKELNELLDRWIGGSCQVRRSSIPHLHNAALWYYLVEDGLTLRRIFALTGNVKDDPWGQLGDANQKYLAARAMADAGSMPKKPGLFGWLKI